MVSVTGLPETVTVEPRGFEDITVNIAPHESLNLAHYGGYIQLLDGDNVALSVPYAGYAGDYQAVEVFTAQLGNLLGAPELSALTELVSCNRVLEGVCAWGR